MYMYMVTELLFFHLSNLFNWDQLKRFEPLDSYLSWLEPSILSFQALWAKQHTMLRLVHTMLRLVHTMLRSVECWVGVQIGRQLISKCCCKADQIYKSALTEVSFHPNLHVCSLLVVCHNLFLSNSNHYNKMFIQGNTSLYNFMLFYCSFSNLL